MSKFSDFEEMANFMKNSNGTTDSSMMYRSLDAGMIDVEFKMMEDSVSTNVGMPMATKSISSPADMNGASDDFS